MDPVWPCSQGQRDGRLFCQRDVVIKEVQVFQSKALCCYTPLYRMTKGFAHVKDCMAGQ